MFGLTPPKPVVLQEASVEGGFGTVPAVLNGKLFRVLGKPDEAAARDLLTKAGLDADKVDFDKQAVIVAGTSTSVLNCDLQRVRESRKDGQVELTLRLNEPAIGLDAIGYTWYVAVVDKADVAKEPKVTIENRPGWA